MAELRSVDPLSLRMAHISASLCDEGRGWKIPFTFERTITQSSTTNWFSDTALWGRWTSWLEYQHLPPQTAIASLAKGTPLEHLDWMRKITQALTQGQEVPKDLVEYAQRQQKQAREQAKRTSKEQYEEWLQGARQRAQREVQNLPRITAEDLKRVCKASTKKGGPDGWSFEDIRQLSLEELENYSSGLHAAKEPGEGKAHFPHLSLVEALDPHQASFASAVAR